MRSSRRLSGFVILVAMSTAGACSDDDDPQEPSQTGGKTATGGSANAQGGSTSTGGSKSTGGSTSMGGSKSTGGSNAVDGGMGGEAGSVSGGAGDGGGGAGEAGGGSEAPAPGADFPPVTSAEAVADWLDEGHYLDWACEPEKSVKDDGAPAIHVHGASSRVCSNVLLATTRGGGAFPRGVAAVKEVYDADDQLVARMVSAKLDADSADGDGWFWSDAANLAAIGAAECKGCHAAADADADHPGAGDFVYFQVQDERDLPPTDDAALVTAWLDEGFYKDWACEDEPTEKTAGAPAIHVHRLNRICTNSRLSTGDLPNGGWPAGIASVKEVYDGDSIIALDLYVKVAAQTNEGQGFYYYGGESSAGFGFPGCVSCHSAAGADADHPGAGDFVYDRVMAP